MFPKIEAIPDQNHQHLRRVCEGGGGGGVAEVRQCRRRKELVEGGRSDVKFSVH